MSKITSIITRSIDLDQGVARPVALKQHLIYANAQAHTFRLVCTCSGKPVSLDGMQCMGYVRRKDGVTIPVEGTACGNVASITLTAACYAVAGSTFISMELIAGECRATHGLWVAQVVCPVTDQVGGEAAVSISDALARVNAAARPDWDQGDESMPDHVRHRTHYRYRVTADCTQSLGMTDGWQKVSEQFCAETLIPTTDADAYQPRAFIEAAGVRSELTLSWSPAEPYAEMDEAGNPTGGWKITYGQLSDPTFGDLANAQRLVMMVHKATEDFSTGVYIHPETIAAALPGKELVAVDWLAYAPLDDRFIPDSIARTDTVHTALSQSFAILRDNFPWDKNADLGEGRVGAELIAPLRSGVKDIRLFGANPKDRHFLSYIAYTDSENRILTVNIQNQDGVIVCAYDQWYSDVDGVVQLPLAEMNASGITGSITIDFDVFTLGHALNYDISQMAETMLSELCYGARDEVLEGIPGELAALQQDFTNLRDNFPWDKNADLGESRVGTELTAPLRKGVKDIRLFGASPRDRHFLSYISYRDSENRILTVYVKNQHGTTVCGYDQWYSNMKGVTQLALSEQNGSGITGSITIDFDVFTLGSALNYDISNMEETLLSELCYGAAEAEVQLLLPSIMHTVVGREWSIYFANILLCDDLRDYQIDCVCDVGQQQNERFVYTPDAVGSHALSINVYKHFTQLVATATVTLQAHAATGSGTVKKVCMIGDSWTANVWYPSDVQGRFADDGDSIELIGTIKPWGDYDGCPIIEGRSGWKAIDHTTQASVNGVTNPFWNPSTSKFDFAYYLSSHGLATPDVVTLFLGINDVAAGQQHKTVAAMQTIIDSIMAANSVAKVGVALLPPPCLSQEGFGAMNGCGLTMHAQKRGAFELSKQYMEAFEGNEHVFFIPVMSAVDMVNNVPCETVKANAYSAVEVKRVTDNVHCDEAGYQQVADAFYGALKALY